MRIYCFVIVLALFSLKLKAQYILNGSFENPATNNYLTDWDDCYGGGTRSRNDSTGGQCEGKWTKPVDGNRYILLQVGTGATSTFLSGRIGQKAIDTLKSGVTYYYSIYYYRFSDSCEAGTLNNKRTQSFGLFLSNAKCKDSSPYIGPPTVKSDTLKDFKVWHRLSGSFIPTQNYIYVMLGIVSPTTTPNGPYVILDKFELTKDPLAIKEQFIKRVGSKRFKN